MLETARQAEAAGVSVLLATDHLGSWGAFPRLLAAADATGLRIGTLVLNNDLRHPTVLAQELATVDAMTDGRLEIGLGAGWNRPEYESAGLPFDPPGQRLRRMQASLRMLRQALSEGLIDHEADEAYPAIHQEGLPTSVQRPHPPFLVGGGGPRLLAFAAREAEIIGIDPRSLPGGGGDPDDITGTAVDRKIGWIREAAGDRWDQLEINIAVWEIDPEFHRRAGPPPPRTRGISEEELVLSPHYLVGDTGEMVETLLARRERWGISYVTLPAGSLETMEPVIRRLIGSSTPGEYEPISHRYDLACGVERAWDVYVNRIGEWWHPQYTTDPTGFAGVTIEPRIGGRVSTSYHDGHVEVWGAVMTIEPERLLVHTSTLAQNPEHPSLISVRFSPRGDASCRVDFAHGGWDDGNAGDRAKFSEWPRILDRFAALADGI